MAILAGSTPKYLLRIRDESGNQLDPSNPAQVTEVKVFIYNALTGTYIARYCLTTSPLPAGYTLLSTKDLGDGDVRVLMVLTSAMTTAAAGNSNEIQVNVEIPDADVPTTGTRVLIRKGKFHEILKAKS